MSYSTDNGPLLIPATCSTGEKPGHWKQICDQVVGQLHEYSETLLRNLRRFLEIGDTHGAEIIQNSCAGCLAHLAVSCDLISRLEPNAKLRMDALCDWSLEQLGGLTLGMNFGEYTYLDLLLRVRHSIDHSRLVGKFLMSLHLDIMGKGIGCVRFAD